MSIEAFKGFLIKLYSRPSTCLSNFVVNGRSVWLELPTRKGLL